MLSTELESEEEEERDQCTEVSSVENQLQLVSTNLKLPEILDPRLKKELEEPSED